MFYLNRVILSLNVSTVKSGRRYNNSGREQAARLTRRVIVEAARTLFISRGYSATTMRAIADEAGVAWQTVYAAFGTKAALLSEVWDVAVVGDDEQVPVAEREVSLTAMAEPDARDVLRGFAAFVVPSVSRVAPVMAVLEQAAPAHPEIAALLARVTEQKLSGMSRVALALAKRNALRTHLNVPLAADVLYAMTNPRVVAALAERGWDTEKIETWLAGALADLLISPEGNQPP
jgi:AcrR family transcriptional regulator